jgi:hypothetical protein
VEWISFAGDGVPGRDLELLAREGPRHTGGHHDLIGHVPRGELASNGGGDPGTQVLVDLDAGRRHDEQRHGVPAVRELDADDEAVGDLRQRLDDAVDLGRTQPDTPTVQRGVGAAGDDDAPPLGDRDPVTLAPDAVVPAAASNGICTTAHSSCWSPSHWSCAPPKRWPPGAGDLRGQLEHLSAELAAVIDELREMARGIHPAALVRGGLPPALKALARRSAVPVDLDLRVDHRLRAQLEEALRTRQAERGAAPPAEVPRSKATAPAPIATVADQDRS